MERIGSVVLGECRTQIRMNHYTLKECREKQEAAKLEGKMADVSWWSGYMAAKIDDTPIPFVDVAAKHPQRGYPLLIDAPDHFSEGFIDFLRARNPVVFENDTWIIIENCKYHTPEQPWLTAFAKSTKNFPDLETLSPWSDWEWQKKAMEKQTVKRFHIHIYKPR
jgi:hypothetical protein